MVYIQTYIFNHFHQQYLVLLTTVPRISMVRTQTRSTLEVAHFRYLIKRFSERREVPWPKVVGKANLVSKSGVFACLGGHEFLHRDAI